MKNGNSNKGERPVNRWVQKTIAAAFDETVGRFPQKECFLYEEQRITYGEMGEKVNAFAKGLLEIGVKKGDKVSLWMSNRPEWMVAKFAVAKIGGILVPVNTRYKTYELEYILKQSDSNTLILMDQFLNIQYLQMLREISPEIESCSPGKLVSKRLPKLKNVIVLGKEAPKRGNPLSVLLGSWSQTKPG